MFFNHKKRYKGFEWDGDETRWPKDDVYFKLYKRLLAQATPRGTPVQMIIRHDASWRMHEQFQSLNGIVDLWVCGGGILSWFPWAPKMLHDRGDLVWFYGGTPDAWEPVIRIAEYPVQAWKWEVDGYCRWLTTSPGEDPWFNFNGGGEAMVYSGERFGLEKPIPSIRLKLERNIIQDVAAAEDRRCQGQGRGLPGGCCRQPAKSGDEDWWNPTPAVDPHAGGVLGRRLLGGHGPAQRARAEQARSELVAAAFAAPPSKPPRGTYEPDAEEAAHGHGAAAPAQAQPQEDPHAH